MPDDTLEYNQSLKPLEELMEGIERPGTFFVSGALEIPMPRVEVEGVGTLSFPVPEPQIQQLIQQATRAPYGRGSETILDESVRKVWQLPPEKVRLSGKSWGANFQSILQQVIAGLGCRGAAISAELYKLLVYDRGGFFLAHRDTEKAEGMFGTLVLVLPSPHRGGGLVIRHAGREVTVDLSGAEISEVKFVAFYADCEHEVRPIAEGSRVCLVFNLIQQRGAKRKGKSLHAPDYEEQIAAAAALLEKNLTGAGAPAKIAWLLEHQYSPDGLSFAGLKSADAARVQVLTQAAERAGCVAHLGIVHIEEWGSAEPTFDDYRPRRRGRGHHDDDAEEAEAAGEDFEVVEVCDWRHYVAQWRDRCDQPVEFGEIPLEPGELLPTGALDDEEPDEQRLMEASGNEGASFERSYHRAALVLWRRERYAEVLLQAGVEAVLPYLEEKIRACSVENAPAATRMEAMSLARMLVNAWRDAPEHGWGQRERPDKRDGMLRLLAQLGDASLLAQFIAEVVIRDYDGSDNTALVACAPLLGAKEAGRLYAELARRHTPQLHAHCVKLLCALAAGNATPTRHWRDALCQAADAIIGKLGEVGTKQLEEPWMDWPHAGKACQVNAALVANLLNTLAKLDASGLRMTAVKAIAARPAVFDPVTILVPALGSLHQRDDPAAKQLWEHGAEFLLNRSGQPPEPPKDWRQNTKLSCACADCRELQTFTIDPVERVQRFRVRQDRRQHLHQMIEKHDLDMTHVTERKGSPQTLVCTKDRRRYKGRCDEYRKDTAALAALAELGRKANVAAAWLERITNARTLADRWSPATTWIPVTISSSRKTASDGRPT